MSVLGFSSKNSTFPIRRRDDFQNVKNSDQNVIVWNHEVVFESNCLELVKCVSEANYQGPWEIRALVEDIKIWTPGRKWNFVWCCREKNKIAHWLASSCYSRQILINSGCIPPNLLAVICKDR